MTSQTKLLDILQINVCCRCRCQKYIVFWLWCISLLNYTKYSNKFLAGQIHIMFSILVWKIIHFISAVNARVNVKNMCYFKMYQLCLSLPPSLLTSPLSLIRTHFFLFLFYSVPDDQLDRIFIYLWKDPLLKYTQYCRCHYCRHWEKGMTMSW